jgi:hypothetical protein
MKTSIKELATLTDGEIQYRVHERILEYAESQGDFKEALLQKWHLVVESASNPFLGGY